MYTEKDFLIQPNESIADYKIRCYQQKPNSIISWRQLAPIMNSQIGAVHNESYYRKEAKKLAQTELLNSQLDNSELQTALLELKKEKVKLADERTQLNSYIRALAREETLKEIAVEIAQQISKEKQLSVYNIDREKDKDKVATLLISDWHYGLQINNYFNTYSPEICKERVSKLVDEVIKIGTDNKVSKLNIVNLSDLIAGRIHLKVRLESREDVISQVIHVSEILAEFLTDLSVFFDIEYYDTLDNHSRLEPIKNDSLELETLARIIPWYLVERLKGNNKITIHTQNKYADDIIAFKIFNFNVACVHGHKDKPISVINNLSAMTRKRNDLILTAHLHHFSCEVEHEAIRVSNGSLMGTDNYSMDLRLTSTPSQTLIISTPQNVASCIYKIDLLSS